MDQIPYVHSSFRAELILNDQTGLSEFQTCLWLQLCLDLLKKKIHKDIHFDVRFMEALKKIPSLDVICADVRLVNICHQFDMACWWFLSGLAYQLNASLISSPQHGRMYDAIMDLMLM